MTAARKITRPSSAETLNHELLLAAAADAKRTGTPITVLGDFVTSWPWRITKGELEGFGPSGAWLARGQGRKQIGGVSRLSSITVTFIGATQPTDGQPAGSQYEGVIAALELLVEEIKALGGVR